jgi:hypothetical protein
MPDRLRAGFWPRLAVLALAGLGGVALADLQSAARESERYAECLNTSDTGCLLELTHPLARVQQSIGISPPSLPSQSALLDFSREQAGDTYVGWRVEVGEPAPVAEGRAADTAGPDQQVVVVPYLLRSSSWAQRERRGYLIGISADGEHWCFADDSAVGLRGIDRFIPEPASALPATAVTRVEPPGRVRTDYLDTKVGRFRALSVEGEGHYELSFEVRKRVRDDIALILAFENPENSENPYIVPSVLTAKQEELTIRSPLITGLRDGEIYMAVVFGIGTDGEELLFEHRQAMVFDSQRTIEPISDVNGRLINATRIEPRMVAMPGPLFPPGWYAARLYEPNDDQGVSGVLLPRVIVDERCQSPTPQATGNDSARVD